MNVGLVDDKTFAQAKVTSLRRQGHSGRSIIARLQVKGLTTAQIEAAMKNVDDGSEDAEMNAANAYARRKTCDLHISSCARGYVPRA